jgi:hypothetical protein
MQQNLCVLAQSRSASITQVTGRATWLQCILTFAPMAGIPAPLLLLVVLMLHRLLQELAGHLAAHAADATSAAAAVLNCCIVLQC